MGGYRPIRFEDIVILMIKNAGSWENTSGVGKPRGAAKWIPNATRVFSQLPKCSDEAIYYMETSYMSISFIK